jgi:hypothetical protein
LNNSTARIGRRGIKVFVASHFSSSCALLAQAFESSVSAKKSDSQCSLTKHPVEIGFEERSIYIITIANISI